MKEFLQNLSVRLGITRAEMTAVTALLLFLVLGGVIRYGSSVQEADKLIREAERTKFSEAEVDSLLRLAPGIDLTAMAEESAAPEASDLSGREGDSPARHQSRIPKSKFTGTVAFNRASPAQLQQIPGIGPAMAKRLIGFRAEKGGKVRQFDDFLDVKGIGKKKLEVLKKHLTLE
ncbi:MAG: helix-hairpin-helix domain-containing protein [Chlorobiaceae bacterium]|nr:helix-hairpin-helix domain-containing protein [Chlorobiaceae bacterium]